MKRLAPFAFIIFFLLPACRKASPSLVGTWQSPDGTSTWRFHSDGSFDLEEPGASLSGTYVIRDAETLELTFAQYDQMLEPQLFEYSLTNVSLILNSLTFGRHEYHRQP